MTTCAVDERKHRGPLQDRGRLPHRGRAAVRPALLGVGVSGPRARPLDPGPAHLQRARARSSSGRSSGSSTTRATRSPAPRSASRARPAGRPKARTRRTRTRWSPRFPPSRPGRPKRPSAREGGEGREGRESGEVREVPARAAPEGAGSRQRVQVRAPRSGHHATRRGPGRGRRRRPPRARRRGAEGRSLPPVAPSPVGARVL